MTGGGGLEVFLQLWLLPGQGFGLLVSLREKERIKHLTLFLSLCLTGSVSLSLSVSLLDLLSLFSVLAL